MVKDGNALVVQAGGCTPVFNRSLYGIVMEALSSRGQGVLGAVHGLDGLLSGRLADLSGISAKQWERIARSPGAALGSSRRKLRPDDVFGLMQTIVEHRIGACFIVGGNDSAETGHSLYAEAKASGVPLTVVNVPKTIDNDLVLTDHSPGYGSAARFVALATMGAGRDAEGMGPASPITIIEVMGRDTGWLAAAAVLGKREERDAPHVICVPEAPVDEGRFLDNIDDAYRRFGFAVAVVAENVRGADGVLGSGSGPWHIDDFGHAYYGSPAQHLAGLVERRLGCRVRYEKPGTIQRSMMACVSRPDALEAEMVGRAAVRYALQGATDVIVALARVREVKYRCTTGLAPLERVAGQVRTLHDGYYDADSLMATPAFTRYARPLIGAALPRLARVL